ncbi:unnamed protein product, partial [Linum tenue]
LREWFPVTPRFLWQSRTGLPDSFLLYLEPRTIYALPSNLAGKTVSGHLPISLRLRRPWELVHSSQWPKALHQFLEAIPAIVFGEPLISQRPCSDTNC